MTDTLHMKRLGLGVGIALIAFGTALAAPDASFRSWLAPAPCTEPITYRIGSVDQRFGISNEDFATAADEAAALWNTAYGAPLFTVSAEAPLPVSLAFDDRQRATQAAQGIDAAQAQTEEQRGAIEERRAALGRRADSLERKLAGFNRRADAYQAEVKSWNVKGGAPAEEHARLEQERLALEAEQGRLSKEAEAVDALALEIGQEVDDLNSRISEINANVDQFNETTEHEFEQGLYIEDEKGKRIVVYEFSDRDELIWVLAHEFGHALGLDHLGDPRSIMHARNLGTAPALSKADKAALTALCTAS